MNFLTLIIIFVKLKLSKLVLKYTLYEDGWKINTLIRFCKQWIQYYVQLRPQITKMQSIIKI